ncbi:glycosyltransferase [Demequina sp.]|uniref:glycosyltransferase n=1 Tax=Demequina sp. TaxID=2050685 RepID=UPI003D0FC494
MRATLTACLIVKDEAKVIERALASVVDVCDRWLIIDTGSTDGTQDVIKSFAAEHDWPGLLVERTWRDFGHNRNELLELADSLPAGERTDWVLYMDADQEVVAAQCLYDEISAAEPNVPGLLVHTIGQPSYWTPRLVRTGVGRWRGRTHEVLCLPTIGGSHTVAAQPRSLATITHHSDGGARTGRLERDEAFLRADLDDALSTASPAPESGIDPVTGAVDARPDEIRTRYYLGATLASLAQQNPGDTVAARFAEAREHLAIVAEQTVSDELAYVALTLTAWTHLQQGDTATATDAYLTAAKRRLGRYEAAFEAVRLLRRDGQEVRAAVVGDRFLHRPHRLYDTFEVYPNAYPALALEVAGAALTVGDAITATAAMRLVNPRHLDAPLAAIWQTRSEGLSALLQPA